MTPLDGQEREMLDAAHRNFAVQKYDPDELGLLIDAGHVELVPAYTIPGEEHAESLKLLERSE